MGGNEVLSYRILVVDDEALNRAIIAECLDDIAYRLDMAVDGEEAWEKLERSSAPYHLILLDRMMPRLDGMALLQRIKATPRHQRIPVIMQTAAASIDQVCEGIKAGVYYYLTKPYAPEALLAIVRAALADIAARDEAARRVRAQADALKLAVKAEFRFRSIAEACSLAALLAHLCPVPETAVLGLTELMMNAVEHGNLGISYADKSLLRRENRWEEEIERRSKLPEYRERSVSITAERSVDAVEFTIVDEGAGFAWQPYLQLDAERAFDPNGRGIAMARMTSFDRLDYRGCGNEVVATVRVPQRRRDA
ncbi:MAG: response regulator [Rhodocyclaceae bacterium]|nr:response regulator [Rhodocyclaceae bacterium]